MWTRQADWQCALNEVDKTELTWYLVVTITRAGALPALFPDPAFILPPHDVTPALVGDLGVDLAPAPLLAAFAASAPQSHPTMAQRASTRGQNSPGRLFVGAAAAVGNLLLLLAADVVAGLGRRKGKG